MGEGHGKLTRTAMKILGAAAARDYSFERCVDIGRAVNEQLVSIGSALDHCHVPGRQNHEEIGGDVCVIGAGIHNEPVSPISPLFLDCQLTSPGSTKNLTLPFSRRPDFPAPNLDLRPQRPRASVRQVFPERRRCTPGQQLRRPFQSRNRSTNPRDIRTTWQNLVNQAHKDLLRGLRDFSQRPRIFHHPV
jgi:hypothetical protein